MTEAELYPLDLLDRLRAGSVTPFIGSGLSIPSGVPGWFELLDGLLDELEANGTDVTQFRQWLKQGRLSGIATPALYQTISSKFNLRQFVQARVNLPWTTNEYHRWLVALPCDVLITTNWDGLVEQGYQEAGIALQKIWNDGELAHFNARQAVQLIKIHGTIDSINSIVFAEDEYANYREKHKHLYNFLSTVVLTQTLLFLGFSCQDPNVRSLLEIIRQDLDGVTRSHYAIIFDADRNEIAALQALGVHVINLPSAGDRTRALADWLSGLVDRSRVVAVGNRRKAATVNALIGRQILSGVPGATIRMRAALGILSNPKTAIPDDPLYGSAEQDTVEIEMGNKARQFLSKSRRNQIRCILHINPDHQRQKGYQWRHLQRRFAAMLEFMDEFGGQIDLAHSPIPIDMNQIIVGRSSSATSFKRGEAVGYEHLTVTANRWVIDSDIRGFDADFDGIREHNRKLAGTVGIDTSTATWHELLSRRIVELALAESSRDRVVLRCDANGTVLGRVSRDEAHRAGIQHKSVHLHVLDIADGRSRVLVQQRLKSADLYEGLFDVSVAGHPESDDILAEILREVREELGLDLNKDQLKLFERRPRRCNNDVEVVDVYYAQLPGLSDARTLHVTREVDALQWIELPATDGRVSARGVVRYGALHIPTSSAVAISDFVPGAFEEITALVGSVTKV